MSHNGQPHETSDDHRVLSGKRKSQRRRRSIGVHCVGASGQSYACQTVNISAGGMLVQVADAAFLPLDEPVELFPFAQRVAEVFPEGMAVVFGQGAVQVRATVVRLVANPGGTPLLQLGVQFEPGLSDVVRELLGLEDGIDETTAPPATIATDAEPDAPRPRGEGEKSSDGKGHGSRASSRGR